MRWRELRRRLPLLLNRSPGTVVVDLSEMTQPSSATVAALLWIKRRCRSRSVVVVLRQPSRRSIDMLRRTGLQCALPIEKPDAGRGDRCGSAIAYARTGPMSSGPAPNGVQDRGAEQRAPGVSTFDVICGPGVRETCEQHVRRWARDRALPTRAADRLWVVTSAALGHGLLYGPRGVSVTMRWADLDRVRVDVRWRGCTRVAQGAVSTQELESTLALLDAVAESWGFGAGSPASQWMVVDSSG